LVVEARNARLHGGLDKDIEDPVATKIWKALNSVKEIKGIYDSSTAEYDEGEQLLPYMIYCTAAAEKKAIILHLMEVRGV
jgi:hypothetical protein